MDAPDRAGLAPRPQSWRVHLAAVRSPSFSETTSLQMANAVFPRVPVMPGPRPVFERELAKLSAT